MSDKRKALLDEKSIFREAHLICTIITTLLVFKLISKRSIKPLNLFNILHQILIFLLFRVQSLIDITLCRQTGLNLSKIFKKEVSRDVVEYTMHVRASLKLVEFLRVLSLVCPFKFNTSHICLCVDILFLAEKEVFK
jgi:hypothetical protein